MQPNQQHTERQIKILEEIGKSNRNNIDKDIRKNTLSIFLFIIIGLSISVLLLTYGGLQFIALAIFLNISMISMSVVVILPKNKKLSDIKEKPDYEIGIVYATMDKRVVGNNTQLKQSTKAITIVMAFLFMISVAIFILASNAYEPITYENTVEIQGTLKSISKDEGDDIHIKMNESDTEMIMSSIYADAINYQDLLNEVNVDDSITIYKDEDYTHYDEPACNILYLKINDIEYLNYDIALQAETDDNNLGLQVFLWFGGITLTLTISGLIALLFIYPKREANEIYDLSLTEAEKQLKRNELNKDIFDENQITKKHIKTTPQKGAMIVLIVFTVFCSIVSLYIFITYDDQVFSIFAGITMLSIGLISFFGARYVSKTYLELKGDTLIDHQGNKTKTLNIFDISKITTNDRFVTIYDSNYKVWAQVQCRIENVREITDVLSDNGIIVEKV